MLLCTGERVWELSAVWVESYISVYHSHSPVFGLVLSLDSADSLVWAYLRADYGEHGVFYPSPPMSLLTVYIDFILLHRTYRVESASVLLEAPPSRYTV